MNDLKLMISNLAQVLSNPAVLLVLSKSDRESIAAIHARAVKKLEANAALYAEFAAQAARDENKVSA